MRSKHQTRPKKRSRTRPAGQDPDFEGFETFLRLTRKGGRLPQGCTPAEKRAALEMLAEMSGVRPIDDPASMTAKFWPADEDADMIVAAIRALRRQRT
jgi:hypothetical protein